MKRVILFFFAAALLFVSCEKEDSNEPPIAPTISIDGGGASMSVLTDEEFKISITALKGNSDFTSFEITQSGVAEPVFSASTIDNSIEKFTYEYTKAGGFAEAGTYTFTFKMTDANAQVAQVSQEVVVQAPAPPSIALAEGEPTAALAAVVGHEFSIAVSAQEGTSKLKTFEIWEDGVAEAIYTQAITTEGQFDYTYSATPDMKGEKTFIFKVIAEDDQYATVERSVTIDAAAIVRDVKFIEAPTAGMNSKTFYSVGQDMLYSYNDVTGTTDPVSQYVDFGYYYGTSDMASLASVSEYDIIGYDFGSWGTTNTTEFKKVDVDFDAVLGSMEVKNIFDNSDVAATNSATELVEGDVLAVKTAAGGYGVLKVISISGTYNVGDGMEIKLKVPAE